MLVISSNTFPIYAKHRELWRLYMKSHPDIDCYFIEYNPISFITVLTNDTLTLRGKERYDTILAKTIDALTYFLPKKPYTHIVRTNLSSVWDFTNLLTYLNTLPQTRLYGGLALQKGGASGAGILFSRDVAELLITYRKHILSIGVADDDDIGTFMQQVGIPLTISRRVDFVNLEHYQNHNDKIPNGTFHYRVKNWNLDNRYEEEKVMRSIIQRIYGI